MFEKIRSFIVYKYIRQLIFRYKEADLPAMSAQITYYLILAFFPFLLFLINMLSFTPLSSELLITNFNTFLPNDTAILVKNLLVQTIQAKSKTLLLLGMIGSLWAASQGISAIIRGLNNSYAVEEDRKFIKLTFIALISTISISVMIIFAFIMLVFGKIIGSYVFGLIGAQTLFNVIWSFLRYGISLALMLLTFYLIYRYVPNKKLKFNDIIVGAIFTTVGWGTTSLLFSFYVNSFANYEKVYGSLGRVIALISWLYISTLIILLGGELNAISSNFENKEKFSANSPVSGKSDIRHNE
ncbi:MAG: YihY/virulence factor BrkB family protein [Desulfosporosinus sp.]|nr:YihY/virulence factor BrkB family protein [Desulfosporosinus sp.]